MTCIELAPPADVRHKTPEEAVVIRKAEILKRIDALTQIVVQDYPADNPNWGHVGSLRHILDNLDDLIQSQG